MIELISEQTQEQIMQYFKSSKESILIVSPFLSTTTVNMLCEILKMNPEIECSVITRCYMKDFLDRANSIDAIQRLLDNNVTVLAVQGLHTKLYIIDDEIVLVGSANFTVGGMKNNIELSILTDYEPIVEKASLYFESLSNHCKNNNGLIDDAMVAEMKEHYQKAFVSRQKDPGITSLKIYGADRFEAGGIKNKNWLAEDVLKVEKDPINQILGGQITEDEAYKHRIWFKFEGNGNDRLEGDKLPELPEVVLDGNLINIVCFRNRPSGIQTGDYVYIVALTTDAEGNNTANIVGRGIARAYQNRNRVLPDWIEKYPWMGYYHHFCQLEDVEQINTVRSNGIPLSQVYEELDKNTYVATIEKEYVKNMAKCQCRRSHLQVTPIAKKYIDNELEKLWDQYGKL